MLLRHRDQRPSRAVVAVLFLALGRAVVRPAKVDQLAERVRDAPVPVGRGVLVDQAVRIDPCPIRCISSRVVAPELAASWLPVCRSSWK